MKNIFLTVLFSVFASFALAKEIPTDLGVVKVDRVIRGLDAPWALAFLPDGSFLITERDGQLLRFKDGNRSNVAGVPRVFAKGQGGLLDIVVARDFAKTREVFISYAEPVKRRGRTALGVAKLSSDFKTLENFQVLFRQKDAGRTDRHFGSRIVEARNGDLFLTIGDRGQKESAQDVDSTNGKVMRIARSGRATIHSLGHRNAQGAALDAAGVLWTVEHGAKGGDEINRPQKGKNYGWPVISFGRHYSGGKIGLGFERPGLEQPKLYWDPSIAPSGMMIYKGSMFPEWKGDIFVGSLKFDMISRSRQKGGSLKEVERLFQDQFTRIRDIRQAPDGAVWFVSVGDGAVYRISR